MLKIHIETDNAAFTDGNAGKELARILQGLSTQLIGTSFDEEIDEHCPLRDINGNTVGHYTLKVSSEDFE